MLVSEGIKKLIPVPYELPGDIAINLKSFVDSNDDYDDLAVQDGKFYDNYDNKGWMSSAPLFQLPFKVQFILKKIENGALVCEPELDAQGYQKSRADHRDIYWMKLLNSSLSKLGIRTKYIEPTDAIVEIPAQLWRGGSEESFYCLQSELQDLIGDHVEELLNLLGLKIKIK